MSLRHFAKNHIMKVAVVPLIQNLFVYKTIFGKRCYVLLVPLGAFAVISVSSVINTFCHIFTPVLVSLVRTLSGALIGAVIGVIAMYILSILLGKEKQN